MIYTSSFKHFVSLKHDHPEIVGVSIARSMPSWARPVVDFEAPKLAPSQSLLDRWKSHQINWCQYTEEYNEKLTHLNRDKAKAHFESLGEYVYLLCWEEDVTNPKTPCHRTLVGEWFGLVESRRQDSPNAPMKTIIAGSRTITDFNELLKAIKDSKFDISEVVSGTARGVDLMGEKWAEWSDTPLKRFPAEWDRWRKQAGFMRNTEMANYADALIAVWDGESKGTKNMIDTAKRYGLKVFVRNIARDVAGD